MGIVTPFIEVPPAGEAVDTTTRVLSVMESTAPPSVQNQVFTGGKNKTLKLPTPIDADKLAFYLRGYPEEDATALCNIFRYGFPIPFIGDLPTISSKNLPSAQAYPALVQHKIDKEIKLGRIADPLIPYTTF